MSIQAISRPLIACVALLLFTLIYCIFSLLIIISFSLTLLIPLATLKKRARYQCMKLFSCAWACFYWVIIALRLSRWHRHPGHKLDPNGWYLVIANHMSWLDILAAGVFFGFKIPPLKFFLKKQLRWSLPLAGLAAHLADFPFLERSSNRRSDKKTSSRSIPKDIQTAQDTCKKLLNQPSTLILFPEGTRFSSVKRHRQKSPHQHLLKPKSAGIATVINEMHHKLTGIVDTTINYQPHQCSIWGFLCGKLNTIEISYQVLPISPELIGDYRHDRAYRRQLQAWLDELWKKKDITLQGMHDAQQ
jgi:1-acyl-sn-glycerol-3-phosphate acyltransferase